MFLLQGDTNSKTLSPYLEKKPTHATDSSWAGLLLRAGTCEFPLVTVGMTPRSFHRKQKKNGTKKNL